jgi:nicotinamidase-related amidase
VAKTALLICDMQNDIAHPDGRFFIPDAAHRLPVMASVLRAFREAEQPVVHVVRSYREDGWDVERFRVPSFQAGRPFLVEGTWGARIVEPLDLRDGEPIIVKRRFSAFMLTELDLLLRRAEVSRIAIVGATLPNCPRTTMFDAVSFDYDVIAIEDGLATHAEETRLANLADLSAIGVRVATSEEVIREMSRIAERAHS